MPAVQSRDVHLARHVQLGRAQRLHSTAAHTLGGVLDSMTPEKQNPRPNALFHVRNPRPELPRITEGPDLLRDQRRKDARPSKQQSCCSWTRVGGDAAVDPGVNSVSSAGVATNPLGGWGGFHVKTTTTKKQSCRVSLTLPKDKRNKPRRPSKALEGLDMIYGLSTVVCQILADEVWASRPRCCCCCC